MTDINPEHERRSREAGPGWLTLQCVRCSNPYKTDRLSVRICPPCAAGGAIDTGPAEISGT